jgi:hypothetical protein
MNIRGMLVVVAVSMTLLGCDDAENSALETTVKGHKIGMSVDQWLEQYSRESHQWDRTALVFGFDDDYVGCEAMADLLVQRFPLALYRCAPAN